MIEPTSPHRSATVRTTAAPTATSTYTSPETPETASANPELPSNSVSSPGTERSNPGVGALVPAPRKNTTSASFAHVPLSTGVRNSRVAVNASPILSAAWSVIPTIGDWRYYSFGCNAIDRVHARHRRTRVDTPAWQSPSGDGQEAGVADAGGRGPGPALVELHLPLDRLQGPYLVQSRLAGGLGNLAGVLDERRVDRE